MVCLSSGISVLLGPLLFLIFVNDLPDWVVNGISMFSDDTKVWRGILTMEDQESLQDDLNKLMSWSDKWLLSSTRKSAKSCILDMG